MAGPMMPGLTGIAPQQMMKPQMQPMQMQPPQKAPVTAQAPVPPPTPAPPAMGAPSGKMPMNTPSGVLPPISNGNTGVVPPSMGGSPVPQGGPVPPVIAPGAGQYNPAARDQALRNLAMQRASAPTHDPMQEFLPQLQPYIDAIHNAPDQASRQEAIQNLMANRQTIMGDLKNGNAEGDNSEFSNEFDRLEARDRARLAKQPAMPQVDPRDAEVANLRRMRQRRTTPPPQGY